MSKKNTATAAPQGTQKKRRQIYFACSGLKPNSDGTETGVMAEIEVPTVRDRDRACEQFKKDYGVEPFGVQGPYYKVRGTASAEKRVSVNVPVDRMQMTGKVWEGVFQGWTVFAHGIKGYTDESARGNKEVTYNDDDIVMLLIHQPANNKEDAPKPRFGGGRATVLRSAVEDAKLKQ